MNLVFKGFPIFPLGPCLDLLFVTCWLLVLLLFYEVWMSNTVVVDDANSQILYSGSWQARNGTSLDLNGTVRGVVGSGSTVTGNATFTFTGTAIAVFGTISPADFSPNSNAPVAIFNVDGIDAAQFIPQQPTGTIVKQLFYGVFSLEDREHTLFISISALDSALWIDYLEYVPTTSTVSFLTLTSTPNSPPTPVSPTTLTLASSVTSSPTSTSISSSSSSATSQITTTSSITTTLTPSTTMRESPSSSVLSTNTTTHTMSAAADNWSMSTSTPGKSNSISTGTIVGAAVGGACVFLAILFVVFFYLCRRRKKINTRDLSSPSEPEMDFWSRPLSIPLMTPFTLSESPTRATATPPNAGLYLHGNQTSGSGYSTQGSTFIEKAGFRIPATSKTNLINTMSHSESTSYGFGDTEVRSHTRGSRPRIYSPHDLALRLPLPQPPSQLPAPSDSYHDCPEGESPPSYRPYTLE